MNKVIAMLRVVRQFH